MLRAQSLVLQRLTEIQLVNNTYINSINRPSLQNEERYTIGDDLCWGVNQAYSRLSTTHGHITDCKLDLVVHAGVCV